MELDLSEMFHRKKRTLMLLAGSAILLGCAPGLGATADALKAAIGQPPLATGALRFSLFVAATYYGIGFLEEFFAALRVNRDRMDSSQLANYEREVEAFAKRLDTEAKSLEQIVVDMRLQTADLPERLKETFDQMVSPKDGMSAARDFTFAEQNMGRLRSADPAIRTAAETERAALYPAGLEAARMHAAGGIERVAASISGLEQQQANLTERVEQLTDTAKRAAKRIRLNKNIYRHRWFSFWVWEFGASVTIYALAALFTFTPIGFAMGEMAGGLVSSPPAVPAPTLPSD